MKRLTTLLLVTSTMLLVTPAGPARAARAARAASPDPVTLGGVTVHLREGTRQVITVNHARGMHARVTFWAHRDDGWTRLFRARDGRIGYGGLVPARKRVQGSGKTPLGTFGLPYAFGMHERAKSWEKSYRRAGKADYWVLDNKSRYYNRWRNKAAGGFRWWLPASDPNGSERLRNYPDQYEFAVTTTFNAAQVRHRGGAIFLHVNGSGATAGCVSAPRWFLKRTLARLDHDRVPVIAIGR